jgi:pyrrolysyl-tRNA synthetase-like protein
MNDGKNEKTPAKTFYRKRIALFVLLEKIKIWPSRQGVLHGIKTIVSTGTHACITTHCGKTFTVTNSKNSRAARWLRNKWYKGTCATCAVPEWKMKKYSVTFFRNGYGSDLRESVRRQGADRQE